MVKNTEAIEIDPVDLGSTRQLSEMYELPRHEEQHNISDVIYSSRQSTFKC